jgi:hypothetical protein
VWNGLILAQVMGQQRAPANKTMELRFHNVEMFTIIAIISFSGRSLLHAVIIFNSVVPKHNARFSINEIMVLLLSKYALKVP